MITKVTLKNFKLHASTEIEAAPITVFIGPNNSGKSSIFQALLALRQAATRNSEAFCQTFSRQRADIEPTYLFQADAIIDIGGFEDVKRHGESEVTIKLGGTFPCPRTYGIGTYLGIEFEVGIRKNRLAYHTGRFGTSLLPVGRGFGSVPSEVVIVNQGIQLPSWKWVESSPTQEYAVTLRNAILHFRPSNRFRLIERSSVTYQEQLPPEKEAATHELHTYLVETPTRLLNLLHPVLPLRGFEEWGFPVPAFAPENLDRLTLIDRALALVGVLFHKDERREELSQWLEDLLGIRIKIKALEGPRLAVRTQSTMERRSDCLLLNEGTGANQLPFILIPVGLSGENDTILLSEPEAHLHPRAQSDIMRLLLRIAKKESKQFFIETHSEHILHALLHAVAKGDLVKNDLAIYYFENDHGTAKTRRLEIDDKGRVEGGLPGFFDQALDELSEYVEALKLKKN